MVHDVLPGLKEGLLICRPRLKDHYLLGPRDIPPEGDEASAITARDDKPINGRGIARSCCRRSSRITVQPEPRSSRWWPVIPTFTPYMRPSFAKCQ